MKPSKLAAICLSLLTGTLHAEIVSPNTNLTAREVEIVAAARSDAGNV